MPPKKTAHPIDAAIRGALAQLSNLMGEDAARKGIRDVVANSLDRVLGTAPAAASKPKAKKTGGSARGPKPGGRQLKAHLGDKAFKALAEDVKDKARQAISKVAAQWKTMSADAKNALLKKVGVDVGA